MEREGERENTTEKRNSSQPCFPSINSIQMSNNNASQSGGNPPLNPSLVTPLNSTFVQQQVGLRMQQSSNPQVLQPTTVQPGNMNIVTPQSNLMPSQLVPNPATTTTTAAAAAVAAPMIQAAPFISSHLPGQSNQPIHPMNVNMQTSIRYPLIVRADTSNNVFFVSSNRES
jgi:hypothetical protein